MTSRAPIDRPHRQADHADVVSLPTAAGVSVELMRSTYRRQTFPRHTHEYFTLGVMLRGVGTLWYRGADRIVHRGDVVLIPPGEVHTGGIGRGSKVLSYLAVHLPAEVLALRANVNGLGGGTVPDLAAPVIYDDDVSAALRRLDDAIRGHDAGDGSSLLTGSGTASTVDAAAADDALTMAIDLVVRRHSDARIAALTPDQDPSLVRIARSVMEDCYADSKITSLRALAERTGVSPFHLVRAFTKAMGLSPHRFLVQTRVRRARQLLASGVPSSFVAAMTGFVDQSHLTTQFKRYVGTTPASYQRCITASLRKGAPPPSR